jgi:hypothetical protein
MSNQSSFVESKKNIMESQNPEIMNSCFSLSLESEDKNIKNISQEKQAQDKDHLEDQDQDQEEMDRLYERKVEAAKEAYIMARDCGTYDYYRFSRDFPDELDEQVKCPTCEEMIYVDNKNGMCYTCFDIEQKLYPDDIPMELRYYN